jgi:hypothetical protein
MEKHKHTGDFAMIEAAVYQDQEWDELQKLGGEISTCE